MSFVLPDFLDVSVPSFGQNHIQNVLYHIPEFALQNPGPIKPFPVVTSATLVVSNKKPFPFWPPSNATMEDIPHMATPLGLERPNSSGRLCRFS